MLWPQQVNSLAATSDIKNAFIKAILFDGEDESEPFYSQIILSSQGSLSAESPLYNYEKPLLESLNVLQLPDENFEISFKADGGMNNLLVRIEYSIDGGRNWQTAKILSAKASMNFYDLPPLEVVDSGYQIQGVNTSEGSNRITAIWDTSEDLKNIDSEKVYLSVYLINVFTASDALKAGPFVIDNLAPSEINNFVVKEDGISSKSIAFQWASPQESHFKNGFYKMVAKEIGLGGGISEYVFGQGDLLTSSFIATNLKEGTKYSFVLFAQDDFGNLSQSENIIENTNALPVIDNFFVSTNYDSEGRTFVNLNIKDIDGDISVKRNKLQLKVYFIEPDSQENQIATISDDVVALGQSTPVFINNNQAFQIGTENGFVKGGSTKNEIRFFWNTAKDLPNKFIKDLKLCVIAKDMIEEGQEVCRSRIDIDTRNLGFNETLDSVEDDVLEVEEKVEIPEGNINRLNAIKLILKAINAEILQVNQDVFFDVPREDAHAGIILTAKKLGIVNGKGEKSLKIQKFFQAEQNINLAEALTMIAKAFDIKAPYVDESVISIEYKDEMRKFANLNLDIVKNRQWYTDIFVFGYFNGIVSQDDKPDDFVDRERFEEMIYLMGDKI
ncbi:hypothetical protein A2335_03475 [Candidatus Peregrinibacteria bacterium RIFOXYB2_FULL_32_7]|nr:MAG: hypothetical protein A2335_03475 [Candidatus Peregrinibacteria bacterium RIFOXYB2_FULL_32_7]